MNRRFAHQLREDQTASMAVEFALLGPILLTLLVGVFQVATYMQNYNAVRSIASDGARYTMIEYQKGNNVTNTQIRSILLSAATNAPYLLDTDRLTISVDDVATSRVTGAKEMEIDIAYTLEDWLPFVTLPETTLNYSRPIFVVEAPVAP